MIKDILFFLTENLAVIVLGLMHFHTIKTLVNKAEAKIEPKVNG